MERWSRADCEPGVKLKSGAFLVEHLADQQGQFIRSEGFLEDARGRIFLTTGRSR